jgi:predicted signal transduction protein with EAL and GGDEF domain
LRSDTRRSIAVRPHGRAYQSCAGLADPAHHLRRARSFSIRRVFDLRNEVRDRRAAQAEADRLAYEDSLTGLVNRRQLLECFGEWTADLDPDEACTLFVIDLDDFKPVNDLSVDREIKGAIAAGSDRALLPAHGRFGLNGGHRL